MTWFEIKRAADEAGIGDDEEISAITCESEGGSKTLQRMVIGRSVKLAEAHAAKDHKVTGCAT